MSNGSERADTGGSRQDVARRSSRMAPFVVGAILIVVAAVTYKTLEKFPPVPTLPQTQPESTTNPDVSTGNADAGNEQNSVSNTGPLAGPTLETSQSDIEIEARQLVAALAKLDGKEPITADQAQKWRDNLQQLIHKGAAAVPAIQQFLKRNSDANYAGVSGAEALGHTTLRGALLNALGQIGAPEATAAMLKTLQTSVYPSDVATLAKLLEAQAPGKYQQEILAAAGRQLSLAASDRLGGANVGPLFQAIAQSGARGTGVAAELAQFVPKWPYYSIITLAGLPDNAGVPAVIEIAQGAAPANQIVAAQALAELAPQNAEASNTVFMLAKSGQLDDSTLAQLAPFVGGRRYQLSRASGSPAAGYLTFHASSGNQDYCTYDTAPDLSGTELLRRVTMIDQLLAALPMSDTAAADALQQQRNLLTARLRLH